ncbi:hypothetical protein GCM10009119_02220 [Algoriphagus jejuensis]|uniref:SprB-like repeat protein n=2 Tax=Algoriphagus jejuensis TaxID=419934 RepID=A0ABN1MV58_9BACT
MERYRKLFRIKYLLLALSSLINYSAWAQFAFNIPNRANDRVEGYSSLMIEVEGKLALCSYNDRGSVFLHVEGGVPPYKFKWNTGETAQGRTGLNSGTYTVLITDSEGMDITQNVVIQPSIPLVLNLVEKKDATCLSANDGSVKIDVNVGRKDYEGDRPPYKIAWSNGLTDVREAEGLAPGTYMVVVSDFYGCDTSMAFNIEAAA